jgi:hypothetical protein
MRSILVYRSTRIDPIPDFLRPLDIIKGNKYATLARTEGNRIREYREVRLLEVDSEEPVPSPDALTGVWSVAVATEALRLWAASGQSQENFAKTHGFPVSRFRSKAAIQARKG